MATTTADRIEHLETARIAAYACEVDATAEWQAGRLSYAEVKALSDARCAIENALIRAHRAPAVPGSYVEAYRTEHPLAID